MDKYELGMEYSDCAPQDEVNRVVVRGEGDFIAFSTQKLVRAGYAGTAVDLDRLADPDVPLAELAG